MALVDLSHQAWFGQGGLASPRRMATTMRPTIKLASVAQISTLEYAPGLVSVVAPSRAYGVTMLNQNGNVSSIDRKSFRNRSRETQ